MSDALGAVLDAPEDQLLELGMIVEGDVADVVGFDNRPTWDNWSNSR